LPHQIGTVSTARLPAGAVLKATAPSLPAGPQPVRVDSAASASRHVGGGAAWALAADESSTTAERMASVRMIGLLVGLKGRTCD